MGSVLFALTLWSRPRGPQVLRLSGTVVRLEAQRARSRSAGPDNVVYAPIVRFTVDGHERQFTGRLATRPSPWTVGQTVQLLYDPVAGRPELIGWAMWSVAVEWSTGGAAAVALGVVLWRRRWWTRPGLWWPDDKSPLVDDTTSSLLPSTAPATAARNWAWSTPDPATRTTPATLSAPEPSKPPPEPPGTDAPEDLGLPPELGDKTPAGRAIRFVVAAAFCGAPAGYVMLAPGFLNDVLHFGRTVKSPMADLIGSWAWTVGLTVGFVAGCCGAVLGDRFVAPVMRFYRRR